MSLNRKQQLDYTQRFQIRTGRVNFVNYAQRKQLVDEGRLLGINLFPPDFNQSIIPVIAEGETNTTPEELARYLDEIALPEPANSVVVVTAPDPPTNLLGTSGDGEVTISFTPGNNNGSTITNYEYIFPDASGASFEPFDPPTGPVSSLTFTGLENGRTYQIQIRAVNANGTSIATPIFYITPIPGGSDLILFLDGANGGSTTIWNDTSGKLNNCSLTAAPTYSVSNGGYYIFNGSTQFGEVPDGFSDFTSGITILAFVNFGVGNSWERLIDFGNGTQSNNILITRVSTTTNLAFEIYNGVGISPPSFSQTLTNGIVNDQWVFVVARLDGTNYLLRNQNTSITGASSVLPTDITRTNNYIGKSNWSGDSLFAGNMGIVAIYKNDLTNTQINSFFDLFKSRYFTAPDAPTSVSGTAGDGQVSVSFTAPSNTGGLPITSYTVTSSPGGFTATGGSSPLIVTGLTNGTSYTFTAVATNSIGNSVASAASAAVTPLASPPSGTYFSAPSTNSNVSTVAVSPFTGGGNSYSFSSTAPNPDYLTVNADNSWAFGTGDFTIEWFQYQTDSNSFPRIFSIGSFSSSNISIACSIEGGTFYAWLNQSPNSFGNATPYKNVWVHFAIVRQSGQLKVYKNGILFGTAISNSSNITNNSTPLYIGIQEDQAAQSQFLGNLTNFRIVKGLAVYTGDFTVPTSALTQTAAANPYGGSNTVAIPAGFTKLLLVPQGDAIAASLTTSLAAYNAAATDDWVAITSTEYTSLQTNISGTTKAGLTDSYLSGAVGTNASGLSQTNSALVSNTVTSQNLAIPANNYLYGFALRYTTTTPSAGMRVYTNTNTASTGGYNQVGNTLPSIATVGISYFVRKGVTTTNGGTAGLLGFFTGTKMDYPGSFSGSAGYIGFNNYSSPTPPAMRYLLGDGSVPAANSTLTGSIPGYGAFQIQGLTTATKQWD